MFEPKYDPQTDTTYCVPKVPQGQQQSLGLGIFGSPSRTTDSMFEDLTEPFQYNVGDVSLEGLLSPMIRKYKT